MGKEKSHRSQGAAYRAPRADATDAIDERERVQQLGKRVATLRARAALAGWRLEAVPGGFDLWRWSTCRRFDSIAEAEQFIDEVAP